MSFSIGYLLTPFEYNYLCVYFHPSELHFVYFDFVKTVSAFLLSATGVPRHFVYFDFVKTVSAFLLSATGVPRHFVYFDFVKTVSAFLLSATGVPRHFVYFDFVKTVSAFLLSATGVPRHSCNDFLLLLCSQAHYATDQWDYSLAALKIT